MRCQECRDDYLPEYMLGFICKHCDATRAARRRLKETRQPRLVAYDAATLSEIGQGRRAPAVRRLLAAYREREIAAATLGISPLHTRMEWHSALTVPPGIDRNDPSHFEVKRCQIHVSPDDYDTLRALGTKGRKLARLAHGGWDIALALGALLHCYRTDSTFKEQVHDQK